jgi:hypothetical protein
MLTRHARAPKAAGVEEDSVVVEVAKEVVEVDMVVGKVDTVEDGDAAGEDQRVVAASNHR